MKYFHLSITIILGSLFATGCSDSSDGANIDIDVGFSSVACTHTVSDSTVNTDGTYKVAIFSSEVGSPTYYTFTGSRSAHQGGGAVDLNYMIHESIGTAKALVVLIAGGQLDAGLVGSAGDGSAISLYGTGFNFLVRSAHLFADHGYKVLTINRPSDAPDYIGGSTSGGALDNYRISLEHAVDLSEMINRANTTNLPVIVAGTSRGGVSAVNHSHLFSAVTLSNPVTSGAVGAPISTSQAAQVASPTFVAWHSNDSCISTPVNGSKSLLLHLPDGEGFQVSGGFNPPDYSNCSAISYHGFYGVESCVVNMHTDWMDQVILTIPSNSIVTTKGNIISNGSNPIQIDLSALITPPIGGSVTYELPFNTTLLGGQIALNGSIATYTNLSGNSGFVDTFVYIANGSDGSIGHNVINVTANP